MNKHLKIILPAAAALVLMFSAGAGAQRMTDQEYRHYMNSSPRYAAADRDLTRAWQALPPAGKRRELAKQRQWIRSDRDRDASYYMRQGSGRADAYTQATRMRTRAIDDYRDHRAGVRPVALPAGIGHYTYAQADQEMNHYWNSLAPSVRKRLMPEHRQWLESGRDHTAMLYQRQGMTRDQALARATMERLDYLNEHARVR